MANNLQITLDDGTVVELSPQMLKAPVGALEDSARATGSGIAQGITGLPFGLADIIKLVGGKLASIPYGEKWRDKTIEMPSFLDVKDPITGKANPTSVSLGQIYDAYGSGLLRQLLPAEVVKHLDYQPQTEVGKLSQAVAAGVSGAITGAGVAGAGRNMGRIPLPPPLNPLALKAVPAGEMTAELAKSAAPAVIGTGALGGLGAYGGEHIPGLDPGVGALMGGFAGGFIPSMVGGRTSNANHALWEIGSANTPAEFQQAARNADFLRNQGSETATVGDVIPGGNRAATAVAMLRGHAGGAELAQRLAGRKEEIGRLTGEALDSVAPPGISVQDATNTLRDIAQARLDQLKDSKNAPFSALKQLPLAPENAIAAAIDDLLRQAREPHRWGQTDAAMRQDIVGALQDPNNPIQQLVPRPMTPREVRTAQSKGQPDAQVLEWQSVPGPQTSLPAISLNIADWGSRPGANNAPAPVQISKQGATNAQRAANTALENNLPQPWQKAFAEALIKSRALRSSGYDPAVSGPLGQIAGHPGAAFDPAIAKLEILTRGQDPAGINQLAKDLGLGAQGTGVPAGPQIDELLRQIARASLEQRIFKGGNSITLRGDAGSLFDRATQSMIGEMGGSPGAVQGFVDKLGAADMLAERPHLSSDPAYTESQNQALKRTDVGMAAQPLQMVRRLSEQSASSKAVTQIAEVLANPTLENLRRLEILGKLDPHVRAALSRAALAGTITGEERK